jgi:ferredoxin
MPHFITSLCLRDGDCIPVCPVRCIVLGKPEAEWPWVYIDPEACIDCGTCVPECPYGAIFPDEDVPSHYQAKEGQRLNAPRDAALRARANERLAFKKNGKAVVLEHTVALRAGQVVNLREDIPDNAQFFQIGPGYKAREM